MYPPSYRTLTGRIFLARRYMSWEVKAGVFQGYKSTWAVLGQAHLPRLLGLVILLALFFCASLIPSLYPMMVETNTP